MGVRARERAERAGAGAEVALRMSTAMHRFVLCSVALMGCASPTTDTLEQGPPPTSAAPPPRPRDADAGTTPSNDAATAGDSAPQDPPSGDTSDLLFAQVVDFAKADLAQGGVVGAAIAIVLDGKLRFSAGVGVKRKGTGEAVTPNTLFRVGSMTKMTLGATLESLAESGEVDLSHPVTEYVPALRLAAGFDPATILVAQTLTHTAGTPDDYASDCATGPGSIDAWFEQQLYPLWAPPGAVHDYSNVGYGIAGLVIAHASGHTMEQEIHDRVFSPAGMQTATFDVAVAEGKDHAFGYEIGDTGSEEEFDANAYDCGWVHAPGGVFASAVDYAHLAETMFAGGGSMLSPKATADWVAPHVATHGTPEERYGYGLIVDTYKGLKRVWHDGAIDGFLSSMWTFPDKRFAVVVLINSSDYTPENIAAKAADVFLDVSHVPLSDYSTPPSTWGVYAGTYNDPYGALGRIVVSFANDRLSASFSGLDGATFELVQAAGDSFSATATGVDVEATFWRESDGTVPWFVTRSGIGARGGVGQPGRMPAPYAPRRLHRLR
jgi:CubicO group peptidase (beta-lactamase class C family)